MEDEFKTQRVSFEQWFTAQFEGELFERKETGEYNDELVNTLFIGFCAGWELRQ